ncbi:MAG: glycosyltransferase [Thermoplasmata archaeon]|nr:glycosyltransferase [Thermoplasmata archaeon]
MRILHVHDIAHIPPLVVRKLREKSIQSDFIEDVRTIDISKYDIVHGHYALNRTTIRAFRAARKANIPFILHCHGSDLRRVSIDGRKPLPAHLNAVSKHVRKGASHIFLSTPDLIEWEKKGEYIPNPVDVDRFKPMPDIDKINRTLIFGRFLEGDKIFGHIKPDRQYDCVNVVEGVKFPDNVNMLSRVPHEELPKFFNQYSEMLGTMCDLISVGRMEAMACGLKTFTDFEKPFTSHYGGDNPDEASDPRAFVEKHHHPDICINRFIEVYEKILG